VDALAVCSITVVFTGINGMSGSTLFLGSFMKDLGLGGGNSKSAYFNEELADVEEEPKPGLLAGLGGGGGDGEEEDDESLLAALGGGGMASHKVGCVLTLGVAPVEASGDKMDLLTEALTEEEAELELFLRNLGTKAGWPACSRWLISELSLFRLSRSSLGGSDQFCSSGRLFWGVDSEEVAEVDEGGLAAAPRKLGALVFAMGGALSIVPLERKAFRQEIGLQILISIRTNTVEFRYNDSRYSDNSRYKDIFQGDQFFTK